ncbi:MAG: ATP-dependent sacrificial sulfur transferase LarE [Acidobacteria bacterium]|nr:ATP-dependent sacrificial sulfur transferase LarE [Acidobacteriota bacterium]MYH31381.1 ATP-dependent sacrificial sulfur transferase LarE [Acidobacteriota bacterium]
MTTLDAKIAHLRRLLTDLDRVVVCFSGGVDSGYLLAEAVSVLDNRAVALTAVSPSLAPEEGTAARRLAEQLGARHLLVDTAEVDDPRYAANPANRCYFCKVEVYGRAVHEALRLGGHRVVDGFNVDDRGDHRPGRQAAKEHGVRSPLDDAGFTKADIREAARRLGLPVWNKPALACLSSRFPYGTAITPERLTRVAACERVLREHGFSICRVRYFDERARIEVAPAEVARFHDAALLADVTARFRAAGFREVEVDPAGYRQGAMNEPTGISTTANFVRSSS